MSHTVKMILGCLLPLMLIFVLPLIGVGGGVGLFLFVILMFACHLLMMFGHDHVPTTKASKMHPGGLS